MKYILEYAGTEHKREDTHLVLMLHGYGANEHDLLGIGRRIGGPITWAGMRAPQPVGAHLPTDAENALIPTAAFGYQWYPLTGGTLDADMRAIELAVDYVLDFLDTETSIYRSVSLLGFSQGMAVATTIARSRPHLLRSLMGLSGYVVDTESDTLHDTELAQARLPVFYGRGDADPVIPAQRVSFTEDFLGRHSVLESHVYTGMQHAICDEEIEQLASFVQKNIVDSEPAGGRGG